MSNKLSLYTLEAVQYELRSKDSLWDEFYPKLQKYCYFLAQNKFDGDDLVQEAMIKAVTYYNQEKITSALLNKIAYNHWVDLVRKRKMEKMMHEKIGDVANLSTVETFQSVDLLMNQFTPRQAIIFLLKEAFQYQVKEIAEILSTTEMAVKASLHRAKKRLENHKDNPFSLESFWDEEERDQLEELFTESLTNQDPTVLIEAIPSIITAAEVPKVISKINFQSRAPLSTLCMAA